jgi:uncharacterized protein YwqG
MRLLEAIRRAFGMKSDASPPSSIQNVDLDELEQRLRPFQRAAWLPDVVDGDGLPAASKFSGIPVLGANERWPHCPNCGRPMQLFVQLNAADLPGEQTDRLLGGFLQLFYCTSHEPQCESECEAYRPHSRSTLLRLLPAPSAVAEHTEAPPSDAFAAKRIVGWKTVVDLPNWSEHEPLGIRLSDEESEALDQAERVTLTGEKLAGWPFWIQGVEYPSCRRCARRMELLFQIDSEQNLPYMFGDVGIGHITQCPEHLDELAFGWACH